MTKKNWNTQTQILACISNMFTAKLVSCTDMDNSNTMEDNELSILTSYHQYFWRSPVQISLLVSSALPIFLSLAEYTN